MTCAKIRILPEKSARAASNTFSLNLVSMLSDCGMAQSELAERIGISQAAVSLWCAGRRCPDFGTLDRICAAFAEFYPDLITGDLLNPMPELWARAEEGIKQEGR